MTSKQYHKLVKELFERDRKKKRTKEEAMQTLIDAGILDEQGNHTEPYKTLGAAVKRCMERHV